MLYTSRFQNSSRFLFPACIALILLSGCATKEARIDETAYEGVRVSLYDEQAKAHLTGASFSVADVQIAPEVLASVPAPILNNLAVYTKARLIKLLDASPISDGSAALDLDKTDITLHPYINALDLTDEQEGGTDTPQFNILRMDVEASHERTAALRIMMEKRRPHYPDTMQRWDAVLLLLDAATSDTVSVLNDMVTGEQL